MTDFPKILHIKFSGGAANEPVVITNNRTGEQMTKNTDGKTLRLESKDKSVVVDLNNFIKGFLVGDIVTASIGGAKAPDGGQNITLTVAKSKPQVVTITVTAVSTTVLTI